MKSLLDSLNESLNQKEVGAVMIIRTAAKNNRVKFSPDNSGKAIIGTDENVVSCPSKDGRVFHAIYDELSSVADNTSVFSLSDTEKAMAGVSFFQILGLGEEISVYNDRLNDKVWIVASNDVLKELKK